MVNHLHSLQELFSELIDSDLLKKPTKATAWSIANHTSAVLITVELDMPARHVLLGAIRACAALEACGKRHKHYRNRLARYLESVATLELWLDCGEVPRHLR